MGLALGRITYLLSGLFLLANLALAQEPQNLDVYKKELMQYHDSGAYLQDIENALQPAKKYLLKRLTHLAPNAKPAIVLDIDDTSLSNYATLVKLRFGGSLAEIKRAEKQGLDPAIAPLLQFFNLAKQHHVAIFFISGRTENERAITVANLHHAGYANWDSLILRNTTYEHATASRYKSAMRKQIIARGYEILVNIGDQKSDIAGGYADLGVKISNPFYFIP